MQVVLDANVLVYAAKQKIDLVSKIKEKYGRSAEIIIPKAVLAELGKLAESAEKGADKTAATLAMQIIKFSNLKVIDLGSGHTDNQILAWAKENRAIVSTEDKLLKKKLEKVGVPLFPLRFRKA